MASNDQQLFLAALAANEDDEVTRLVYADWLDENDQPEEADRQRKWTAAKAWLVKFTSDINWKNWKMDKDDEYVLDKQGNRILEDGADPMGRPHNYMDIIEAGHDAVNGVGYCFGSDEGSDFFHRSERNSKEFFRNWSIVTGVPVPKKVIEKPPFRCAC